MAGVFAKSGTRGFEEVKAALRSLQNAAKKSSTNRVIEQVQEKALRRVDQIIYGRGSSYGTTLSEIFSKTRPRRKDNKGSVGGRGRGTPVLTGRLQKSLTDYQNEFAIYERRAYKNGNITIKYGADPVDPKTGKRYFAAVESKFNFFQDGIQKFEQSQTVDALGRDLAQIFNNALLKHFSTALNRRR